MSLKLFNLCLASMHFDAAVLVVTKASCFPCKEEQCASLLALVHQPGSYALPTAHFAHTRRHFS